MNRCPGIMPPHNRKPSFSIAAITAPTPQFAGATMAQFAA